jgi:hypothetical protein
MDLPQNAEEDNAGGELAHRRRLYDSLVMVNIDIVLNNNLFNWKCYQFLNKFINLLRLIFLQNSIKSNLKFQRRDIRNFNRIFMEIGRRLQLIQLLNK